MNVSMLVSLNECFIKILRRTLENQMMDYLSLESIMAFMSSSRTESASLLLRLETTGFLTKDVLRFCVEQNLFRVIGRSNITARATMGMAMTTSVKVKKKKSVKMYKGAAIKNLCQACQGMN